MTCKAEEQALADMRLRQIEAAYHAQLETAKAEVDVLRSDARIFDWAAVRLTEAMVRCWDTRCALAADALEQCKKKARNREAVARLSAAESFF
ncbi:MAG: hypothetical protein ACXVIG_07495 [Halobacteriota archaeon]